MRNKEFIPYEQALALQQLGFNEECFGTWFELEGKYSIIIRNNLYRNDLQTPSPLYQQAFRFFREKYSLFGCIDLHTSTPIHWYIRIDDIIKNDYMYHSEDENLKFDTYEEAELECLKKLIEIVKNK